MAAVTSVDGIYTTTTFSSFLEFWVLDKLGCNSSGGRSV